MAQRFSPCFESIMEKEMKQLKITKDDARQRLDKYLKRNLKGAHSNFIYKMLRKKNIVLNGKKAEGSELLCENDEVMLFFSDETYEKLRIGGGSAMTAKADSAFPKEALDINENIRSYSQAYNSLKDIEIVFENEHILILNKPVGVLSQKAKPEDLSANEWLIGYLLETGFASPERLLTFKPSVCNRLDRNTSGLLICGKTLAGSRYMSKIIKYREIKKYYYVIVAGNDKFDERVNGWIIKDERNNKAEIFKNASDIPDALKKSAEYIDTSYKTIKAANASDTGIMLIEAQLFTGKTHQIRVQLGKMGYPVIGDRKYGNDRINRKLYDTGVRNQMLHAYKIVFPKINDEDFSDISEKTITCAPPEIFDKLVKQGADGGNGV